MKMKHMICFFSFLFCAGLLFSQEMPSPDFLPGAPSPTIHRKETSQPHEKIEVKEKNGKIASLELRGVDILDVLKIIAKQSAFNIVTGKNVRGPVTVYLKDIEVWDAFQLIIKANQLAYVREGDNILVMTEKDYQDIHGRPFIDLTDIEIVRLQYAEAANVQKILTQIRAGRRAGAPARGQGIAIDERANAIILTDTPENIAETKKIINEVDVPTSTYIQSLRYLDCREVEKKIKPMLTKQGSINTDLATNKIIVRDVPENIIKVKELVREFDTESIMVTRVFNLEYGSFEEMEKVIAKELTPNIGRIQSDKRSNKIVVVDLPENVERIKGIIKGLDERTRQVLIEAKIIQVVLNDKNQMGINWEKAFYDIERYHHLNIIGGFELASKGALSPGTEVTVGELGDWGGDDYTAFLQMLQTIGDTRTLSNPRIMAINNEEASIHVGTKEAYVTQTVSQAETTSTTAETVNFVDVGVTLKVTPTINRENMITMKIRPEVSTVTSTLDTAEGNVIPILSTSETETNIMIKDGVTIVIGGLIKDEKIKSVSQVPILGSIPILGILFRKKSNEIKKTELVILLTPRIITGEKGIGDFEKNLIEEKISGKKL
ncbi:MAG: hypothetical protein ISS46_03305 [Candidatus Omnitrophica bacterium]|nr:hypothetical protein [Candidatus Omnitrophota bacterium]